MMIFLIVSCVFGFIFPPIESISTPFFRKDYKYIESQQTFYKLHTIHRTWQDAKNRCTMEGAKFFYPLNAREAQDVITYWNNTQTFHWVFVGISDLISKGSFETYDGVPIGDIYDNWGQGEPNDSGGVEDCVILRRDGELNDDSCGNKYPFLCSRTLISIEWNSFCDLPDSRYLYDGDLGKCYKIHYNAMSWVDAYSLCYAEQSYLTVINTKKEADHLVKLIENSKKSKIPDSFHMGFHNRFNEGWKTLKGVTLEETGFNDWLANNPDDNKCGALSRDGKLKSVNCNTKAYFICEHDIGSLAFAIDERLASVPNN